MITALVSGDDASTCSDCTNLAPPMPSGRGANEKKEHPVKPIHDHTIHERIPRVLNSASMGRICWTSARLTCASFQTLQPPGPPAVLSRPDRGIETVWLARRQNLSLHLRDRSVSIGEKLAKVGYKWIYAVMHNIQSTHQHSPPGVWCTPSCPLTSRRYGAGNITEHTRPSFGLEISRDSTTASKEQPWGDAP